jgi:hypothetical protein
MDNMKDRTANAYDKQFNSVSVRLNKQYNELKADIDTWHGKLIAFVEDMYLNTLIELDTSYERFDAFRQTLRVLLDDERLTDRTAGA